MKKQATIVETALIIALLIITCYFNKQKPLL